MKRLLFFAALIVAIGSIGGNMLTAHAQTAPSVTTTAISSLTPTQIAALKQQLQVAQATLVNLEMQNGIATPADAGTPSAARTPVVTVATTRLSASQVSAFKATLNTLAATLTQMSTLVVSNSTLTPSQETAVQKTLTGMQGTLVAIANEIANSGNSSVANSASIATTQPAQAPVAVNNTHSSATAPAKPAAPTQTQSATPAITAQASPLSNNAVPQTAQASSIWSFTKTHWPTIVIVLLVIAILAILFWPEKKESVRTVSTDAAGSGKPKSAPTSTVIMPQSQNIASAKPMANATITPPPATPVANAVAAPAQK